MNVFLDALQAPNQSGTGTYVENLLHLLPNHPAIDSCTALTRPGSLSVSTRATRQDLARSPRPRAIWRRHFTLGKSVQDTHADILHFPANFGTLGPLKTSAAVVITLHDVTFLENPAWFTRRRAAFYATLAKRSARQADILITDSQSAAAEIRERLGVNRERIRVVPLGVADRFATAKTDAIEDVRKRYNLPSDFFLFVGTIEPRKNVVRLLRAWDQIAPNCSADLVIAGRPGWKTDQYERTLAGMSHANRVHTPGFIAAEDLPAAYASARAFVWPSLAEGFGLPPLEAMASGTPVITSNCSSLPEVVGNAALQVDPQNKQALADAMKKLASDPTLRETLIAKGRARAAQFTWQRTVDLTVAAYRDALELRK